MEASAELLFDFEEASKSCFVCGDDVAQQNVALEAMAGRLEALTRHPSGFARQLFQDVTSLTGCLGSELKSAETLHRLAQALAALGYEDVSIRTVLGGGSSDCFKSLRHEFLMIRGTGEFRGMEFIVEPSLRQHFAIPHPSPDYDYVLSRTPDVFVGGSCRLVSIVQLLSALMADSFSRQGLALPPWRREAAMVSKWLPNTSRIRDSTPFCPDRSDNAHSPLVAWSCGCGSDCSNSRDGELPNVGGLPGVAAVPRVGETAGVGGEVTAPPPRAAIPLAVTTSLVVGFQVHCDLGQPITFHAGAQSLDANNNNGVQGDFSDSSSSSSASGELPPSVQPLPLLPDVSSDEAEDEECASPFLVGASPHGDYDSGSFLLTSSSAGSSVYDASSLMGSPSALAGCPRRAAVFNSISGLWGPPSPSEISWSRRPTITGMLPCASRGTGALSAKLLFEPLATTAAAAAAAAASSVELGCGDGLLHSPPAVAFGSESPLATLLMEGHSEAPPRSSGAAIGNTATAVRRIRLEPGLRGGARASGCGADVGEAAGTPLLPPALPPPRGWSCKAPEAAEWLPWGLPQ